MPVESNVYTLDEALSTVGFGKYQVLLLIYAGFGWATEAMELMLLSFIGPALKSEWGLSSSEESLISTVVFAGMLIGAYSWGVISDTNGRRTSLLGIAMVTSGAGMLSTLSPNYISLVILRGLVGIGLGGSHVYTSWFLEFVPTPSIGTWMVIFSTFWTIGTVIGASLAWIVMPSLGWRCLLALSATPSFTLILVYCVIPETPRYLCLKGKTSEARSLLEDIASLNQTKLPPGVLIADQIEDPDEALASPEDTRLLITSNSKRSEDCEIASSRSVLFSAKLLKTTFLLWMVYFGDTFSYYGIVLLTSALSSGQSKCGSINLLSGDMQDSRLYLDVFITSLAEFPGLVLSALTVDRIGRKLSMAVMLLLGFVLLLPLLSPQDEFWTTSLLFGARMFVSATSTVLCIYAPEVYPTSARSTGVGISTSIGLIVGMICPPVAVGLVSGCHQTAAVVLFECVIVVVGLCVMCFLFETNGRELIRLCTSLNLVIIYMLENLEEEAQEWPKHSKAWFMLLFCSSTVLFVDP